MFEDGKAVYQQRKIVSGCWSASLRQQTHSDIAQLNSRQGYRMVKSGYLQTILDYYDLILCDFELI